MRGCSRNCTVRLQICRTIRPSRRMMCTSCRWCCIRSIWQSLIIHPGCSGRPACPWWAASRYESQRPTIQTKVHVCLGRCWWRDTGNRWSISIPCCRTPTFDVKSTQVSRTSSESSVSTTTHSMTSIIPRLPMTHGTNWFSMSWTRIWRQIIPRSSWSSRKGSE